MSFFKSKHVVVAMIVTPILAMLGYYVTDLFVKEKAQPAVAGNSYALLAKSNCRFTSGECDLTNGNFRSKITVRDEGGIQVLYLEANHPLNGVTAGFVENDITSEPVKMNSVNNDQLSWSIPMTVTANEKSILRLSMMAYGSHYFAETTLGFSKYETSFNKNF